MAPTSTTLTFVIPGLLGPLPGMDEPGFPWPAVPGLERLLSRARTEEETASGLEALLFSLFQVEPAPSGEPPVAAVSRLADAGEGPSGWWLRADPVYLRPDQDRLLLFGPDILDLTLEEAQRLGVELHEVFAPLDAEFLVPHARRWYLRFPADPGVRTSPLADVAGRDIHEHLPAGAAARRWRAALNEAQMVLHASPVNQAREADGRPPANSIWPWGGGAGPVRAAGRWSAVWSDEPTARGLARLAGIPDRHAPDAMADWLSRAGGGAHLVVLEDARLPASYGDLDAWSEAVSRLDRLWFRPLCDALLAGRIREAVLCAGGRRFRLTRSIRRRFWKRRRMLASFVSKKY